MTRLKILFITCVAVLGIAALPAMAQAASPEWVIGGKTLTEVGNKVETSPGVFKYYETISTEGSNMKLEIEGVATIECSKMTGTGEIIDPKTDAGTINFTGCIVVGQPACAVRGATNGVGSGEITPGALVTELKLVAPSTVYDVFSPAVGTTFVEIKIEGGTCAAANTYPITGNVAGLGQALGTESVKQPLEFSKAISTAAGTSLKAGKKNAYMIGSATNKLTGKNALSAFGAR